MARVVVTDQAKRDLRYILSDLANRAGYRVAERYAVEFKSAYRLLNSFPDSGSPRQALGPDTRIVLVLPYIVIYESKRDTVTVLRVMHGKRNITRDVIR